MKKMMIFFVFMMLSISILSFQNKAIAGDYYIERVDFDGDCVKVVYGSTEDDSRDRGHIEVLTYTQSRSGGWKKVHNFSDGIGGVSGGGHYKEFCGIRLYRGKVKVIVKIYHNRKREDTFSEIYNM